MTEPAPDQTPKPRAKRTPKPADEAHATLRQSRSRLAGNQLRVSLSEGVTQEVVKVREEFRRRGQPVALVDEAADEAIERALKDQVRELSVRKLKSTLADLLDVPSARGPLTTSPPDRGGEGGGS